MKCLICGKEISRNLASHIRNQHDMCAQDYYDAHLKQEGEGVCIICGKPTKFTRINKGYLRYCSSSCSNSSIERVNKIRNTCIERYGVDNSFKLSNNQSEFSRKLRTVNMVKTNLERYGVKTVLINEDIQERAKLNSKSSAVIDKRRQSFSRLLSKFEVENDCTNLKKLIKKYGQGFLKIRYDLETLSLGNYIFVKNSEIYKIEEYYTTNYLLFSKNEKTLVNEIKSIYFGKIVENDRLVLEGKELDIYLPELKLAIEYNGTYWHSTIYKEKDYHLNKSLLCRDKNIRLIHIYEFEDFNDQLNLLKQLILGNDLYPKNDFNKNNLIKDIPDLELIYSLEDCLVYGSGSLK